MALASDPPARRRMGVKTLELMELPCNPGPACDHASLYLFKRVARRSHDLHSEIRVNSDGEPATRLEVNAIRDLPFAPD